MLVLSSKVSYSYDPLIETFFVVLPEFIEEFAFLSRVDPHNINLQNPFNSIGAAKKRHTYSFTLLAAECNSFRLILGNNQG